MALQNVKRCFLDLLHTIAQQLIMSSKGSLRVPPLNLLPFLKLDLVFLGPKFQILLSFGVTFTTACNSYCPFCIWRRIGDSRRQNSNLVSPNQDRTELFISHPDFKLIPTWLLLRPKATEQANLTLTFINIAS